jgi:hypothetical protein
MDTVIGPGDEVIAIAPTTTRSGSGLSRPWSTTPRSVAAPRPARRSEPWSGLELARSDRHPRA